MWPTKYSTEPRKTNVTINIRKLTDPKLMRRACAVTTGRERSRATLPVMYRCEHSPIRTPLFWIEMEGIPAFVSTHFVRHKVGVEHFVHSLRDDRNGDGTEDRNSLVTHAMLINAAALIQMSRKRLCYQAHEETRKVMGKIKDAMEHVDQALANNMRAECRYRGNRCPEPVCCGKVRLTE